MKRLLFYPLAVLFIAAVTAATSMPAGHWKLVPTFVAAAAAVVAEWALFWRPLERQEQRRERAGQGLCPECGYNLTANASGVCPECGKPIVFSCLTR